MGATHFSGPVVSENGFEGDVTLSTAVTLLTAATGTASDTISDVGTAFDQDTLNDNFKSIADKINEILAALGQS
jgi:hypothetical protein